MRRRFSYRVVLGLLIVGTSAASFGSNSVPYPEAIWREAKLSLTSFKTTGQQRLEEMPVTAWERMAASIEADAYAVRPARGFHDARRLDGLRGEALEVYNRTHALRATFTEGSVRLRPSGDGAGSWEWVLKLERFGYEGSLEPVEEVAPIAQGNRVEYRRGALTEWYVNEPRGLEHGFTILEAPSSEGTWASEGASRRGEDRTLVLGLRAIGLETRQEVAGESIVLLADDGTRTLYYRGLIAWGADGAVLPARMTPTEEGIRIEVEDRGAVYPLTIDPFVESTILLASDWQPRDGFGYNVSMSSDTAVASAFWEDGGPGDPIDNAGAVYVFQRDHGGADNWGEVKKLTASDAQSRDYFGEEVAISGDTVIVGARGAAYVFERDHGGTNNWGEVKKLSASGRVAISGDTAIVGVTILERNHGGTNNWGDVKELSVSGNAAISGDTAIVAHGGPPSVYVFERDHGGADNWGEIATYTGPGSVSFGYSVAISGDIAMVGDLQSSPGWPAAPGTVRVFERNAGGRNRWGKAQDLTASDRSPGDWFGSSVSISGHRAIVGAPQGPGDGAAYAFERPRWPGNGTWLEVNKLTASAPPLGGIFGQSVALSGDNAIIGSRNESAHVFGRVAPWAFVLDGLGGLHVAGPRAAAISPPPPYFGFDIARDVELLGAGAYVLDGFGYAHPAGDAGVLDPQPMPYFGFDVGKDLEVSPAYPSVVGLDGFGGVYGGSGTPYFGWDAARDLERVRIPDYPYYRGFYVLDGWGGLYRGGGAVELTPPPPYFGFDIARDLELAPGGGAYVLDGFGGVHAFGGAPVLAPATPYFAFDAAQDLELASDAGYYVLDSYGGLHFGGAAVPIVPPPPYFGFPIARDLEIR